VSSRTEGVSIWKCDLCGRVHTTKSMYGYPPEWGDVSFHQPPDFKRRDLCPPCVKTLDAFLSQLGNAGPAATPPTGE
jgi:hypothetical protein